MDAELVALAEAHGVATWYEDWHRERRDVAAESVVGVLGLLGVDATTRRRSAASWPRSAARAQRLPGTVVVRAGRPAAARPGRSCWRTAPRGGHRDPGRPAAGLAPAARRRPGGHPGRGARRLPEPPETWGWMLQLYALHSAASGAWATSVTCERSSRNSHGAG